ncbi:MAG: hypothetical protein U0R70_11740 [Solirubrobacteraceae bacterium]
MPARCTRRAFVAGAAGLGAAAAAGAWPRRLPAAPAGPPRCIVLGPAGVLYPSDAAAQSQRYAANRRWILAGPADPWVRLWLPYDQLAPGGPAAAAPPGTGVNAAAAPVLAALDADVAAAKADGRRVILTVYSFPGWSNGTAHLRPGSEEEIAFAAPDRMAREDYEAWAASGPSGLRTPALAAARAGLAFRMPADGFGPESDWAGFIRWAYGRYRPGSGSGPNADALEICNEPNGQLWPQQSPPASADPRDDAAWAPTALTAPDAAAEMLATATAIGAAFGHGLLLLGPATADASASTRRYTAFDRFNAAVLEALGARGYAAHPRVVWTHHDYNDAEDPQPDLRTAAAAAQLEGRWRGARRRGRPAIWLTEGGVRLAAAGGVLGQAHALAAIRERRAAVPAIGLASQYLYATAPSYDCGLVGTDGAVRPGFADWKAAA